MSPSNRRKTGLERVLRPHIVETLAAPPFATRAVFCDPPPSPDVRHDEECTMEVVTALCVSCLCVCVFVCVRDEGGGSQTTVCGPPHSLPNNPYYYVTVDPPLPLSYATKHYFGRRGSGQS